MTSNPTPDRPEVDDPRVLALAKARQHIAYSSPLNFVCPPWDGLTEQEQHLSLLDARNYLHAAITAGLAPAVSAAAPPTTRTAESSSVVGQATRDRIAEALADALKPRYGGPQHNTPGGLPLTATAEEVRLHRAQPLADAVLAVLPSAADWDALVTETDRLRREGVALHERAVELDAQVAALQRQVAQPADRAAVLALVDRLIEHCPDHGCVEPEWEDGCHCEIVPLLRRLADEAQQSAVGAQASADLIEDYLRFLRGQGPEPDLSDLPSEQREAVAGQFEIVKALADRDPELPPLDRDPVALRLGLIDAAPAAECSAQHRNFDDGRLCIRAAQHRGDHIDERGFHWSDTVAVYPVGGGTFRSGVRPSAVGARQPDTETPNLPYTYTDDDGDKFTVATTTASTLDGEAPVVTLDIDGTGGGVVYVRPERVEEVVTALRVAGHTASSAVPGRPAATSTDEETRPETVHGCPPDGSGLTPCCGRTPFELPLGDRISSEAPITCRGPQ